MLIRSKIERIQKKMSTPNEEMMELEREQNKEVEYYQSVVCDCKFPERKKIMQHDIAKKTMESKKADIKNL